MTDAKKDPKREKWADIAGKWLLVLAFGPLSFDYAFFSLTGHDAPLYADVLGGICLCRPSLRVAVVCLALRASGVVAPFFAV